MCCCLKPNVNGEPGYSWDGKQVSTRQVDPPTLKDGDVLLYDEPGRCGGMDSHCHHYRVIRNCGLALLVKHGGGEDRVRLSLPREFSFDFMDSNTRYWVLNAMYHAHSHARSEGAEAAGSKYRTAFAEGRLKKRKAPGRNFFRVWIEDTATGQATV